MKTINFEARINECCGHVYLQIKRTDKVDHNDWIDALEFVCKHVYEVPNEAISDKMQGKMFKVRMEEIEH